MKTRTADPWDPTRYERFKDERLQPFRDLLDLVQPTPGALVVDLGCGTGETTRSLHREMEARETIGVDSSAAMLDRARQLTGEGLRFEQADIAAWQPAGRLDIVFSNAALHWVADHEALLDRLTGMLSAEGQIAIQMPANHDHPSHVVAAGIAAEAPFAEALGGWKREVPVLQPEAYALQLHRLGYARQHVRLQVYGHLLESADSVVEWVRGTTLTDYERRMPGELFGEFVERYRARLVAELGDAQPYFFPFKRLLLWGGRR